MKKNSHKWSLGEEPPAIGLHSIAKHDVLRAYLEKYIEVLTVRLAQDVQRLTLIDGFAGGGVYLQRRTKQLHVGSPLIMLEAMQCAESRARELRQKPFRLDVRYVFVEKSRRTLAFLRDQLRMRGYLPVLSDSIDLVRGDFESNFEKICEVVNQRGRKPRAIFLLDQCGYGDVPLQLIRTIFRRFSYAEVILTFATDWLLDYATNSGQSRMIFERIGLTLPHTAIANIKKEEGPTWRQRLQIALHDDLFTRSGAEFYTPFFIVSAKAHRAYWLVHLSNHPRARDVMTTLHWGKHNHFEHYGRPGLKMLGYDPRQDFEAQGYPLLPFKFDGEARQLTITALRDELPKCIRTRFPQGITFDDLFRFLTNETPATKEYVREVMQELSKEREVVVISSEGKHRERGAKPQNHDLIRYSRQKKLTFQ